MTNRTLAEADQIAREIGKQHREARVQAYVEEALFHSRLMSDEESKAHEHVYKNLSKRVDILCPECHKSSSFEQEVLIYEVESSKLYLCCPHCGKETELNHKKR